jgi:hypothetical protein
MTTMVMKAMTAMTATADTPDEKAERIRDAKMKELSGEAKKWRLKYREAEKRIAELGDSPAIAPKEHRDSRLESAFLRSMLTAATPVDVESAWDLAVARGFFDAVKDDTGDGMDEALDALLDRYPWLANDASADDGIPPLPKTGGARKTADASPAGI